MGVVGLTSAIKAESEPAPAADVELPQSAASEEFVQGRTGGRAAAA